jgi:pimeloyl-ACP methyl ester carboxylesterase
MTDWWSSAIGGLVGASAGGSITAWVASRRLRFDRTEADSRRRNELRSVARPVVVRIADLFSEVETWASPSSNAPLEEGREFGEAWIEKSEEVLPQLRRLVLEVPDAEFRGRFDTVLEALEWSGAVRRRVSFLDHKEFVETTARLGAELAGAWLRDDRSLPPALTSTLRDLDASLSKIERDDD